MSEPAPADTGSQGGALPPGTRLGEYELRQVIGVGGFGIVYLAVDHGLERDVAIKEYMPSSIASRTATQQVSVVSQASVETFALGLRSFVNEARLLARFDHPSLIKVHRFWEERGTAYMVMPLLRGRTLREVRLSMSSAPDEDWLRGVLDPLLGALEVLHREDVFHRDIAPDNILVGDDGVPILLDFGAARRVLSGHSQNLTAILKPSYAPIEQYGESPSLRQGAWTDLYALGATLHFLVTGSPPAPATVRAVHDETPKLAERSCPGVGRRLLEVVDWMLATRPGDRPQSVAEVREALAGRRPEGQASVGLDDRTVVMTGRPAQAELEDDATVVLPGRSSPLPTAEGRAAAAAAARSDHIRSEASARATKIENSGLTPAQNLAAPSRSAGLWVGAVAVLLVAGAAAAWFIGKSAPAPALSRSPAASMPADAVATAQAVPVTPGTPATSSPASEQSAPAASPPAALALAALPSASPAADSGQRSAVPVEAAPARNAIPAAPPAVPPMTRPAVTATGTVRPVAPATETTARGVAPTDARPTGRPMAAERRGTGPSGETASVDRRAQAPIDTNVTGAPRAAPYEPVGGADRPVAAPRVPEPAAEGTRDPRGQCGNRLLLALHSCLLRECVKPEYRAHPECQRVRAIEERAGRPMP